VHRAEKWSAQRTRGVGLCEGKTTAKVSVRLSLTLELAQTRTASTHDDKQRAHSHHIAMHVLTTTACHASATRATNEQADKIIFPGVGNFGFCMSRLNELGCVLHPLATVRCHSLASALTSPFGRLAPCFRHCNRSCQLTRQPIASLTPLRRTLQPHLPAHLPALLARSLAAGTCSLMPLLSIPI
jgi:hypothetical protein